MITLDEVFRAVSVVSTVGTGSGRTAPMLGQHSSKGRRERVVSLKCVVVETCGSGICSVAIPGH